MIRKNLLYQFVDRSKKLKLLNRFWHPNGPAKKQLTDTHITALGKYKLLQASAE